MLRTEELLKKMDSIAEELVGNEQLYQIFTKCMADIDNLRIYDPYKNIWEYAY